MPLAIGFLGYTRSQGHNRVLEDSEEKFRNFIKKIPNVYRYHISVQNICTVLSVNTL